MAEGSSRPSTTPTALTHSSPRARRREGAASTWPCHRNTAPTPRHTPGRRRCAAATATRRRGGRLRDDERASPPAAPPIFRTIGEPRTTHHICCATHRTRSPLRTGRPLRPDIATKTPAHRPDRAGTGRSLARFEQTIRPFCCVSCVPLSTIAFSYAPAPERPAPKPSCVLGVFILAFSSSKRPTRLCLGTIGDHVYTFALSTRPFCSCVYRRHDEQPPQHLLIR